MGTLLSRGRKLRVCYVAVDVPVPSTKGSSTHVTEVASGLQSLGASVVVLSRRLGPWQPASERFRGFMLHRVYRGIFAPLHTMERGQQREATRLGPFSMLYRFYLSTVLALYCGLAAARLVRKYGLEVVIERETSYGAGAIASFLTGRALVLEVNGPNFSPLSSRRATIITAYSHSMVGENLRKKTRIVDAGVNTELFQPDQAARLAVRAARGFGASPVVGYVGSFQVWHGIADLVCASKSVLKANPEVKFLMVGPGFSSTKALAEELKVAGSFVFTGPVTYSEVPDYINACDIMVSPTNPALSEWTRAHGPPEQFKIFEYMACKKPVVMTSVGPMLRIVKNRETGLTVSPGDSQSLAGAICELIRDASLANSLADRGYSAVVEKYGWANHAGRIHEVASEALEGTFPGVPSRRRD
ncbi:MAG: glycosyltransferase [Nitrososphaerota archaeon]|nr:glycosyltransferase [Nitrososphaerota archaeon]